MTPSALPSPLALRLVSPAGGRAPRAPFGVKAWSDAADAIAIVLDVPREWPSSGLGDLATVVRQVPEASMLAASTLVVVLGDAVSGDGLLARWKRPARISRALRASALLARGFAQIGGGVDAASGQDVAWGWSASSIRC